MDVSLISLNQYLPSEGNIVVKLFTENTSPIITIDKEETQFLPNVLVKDKRLLVSKIGERVDNVVVGDIVLFDAQYFAQPIKFREGQFWQVRWESVLGKITPYNPNSEEVYRLMVLLGELKNSVYQKTGNYILFGSIQGSETSDFFNRLYSLKSDFVVNSEQSNKQTGLYVYILPKNMSIEVAKDNFAASLADKMPNKHKNLPNNVQELIVRDYEQLSDVVDKLTKLNNGYTI